MQGGFCQPKHPGMFALSAEKDTLRPLLPVLKGLDYRGAWSMSPNRKLMAVAVSPEQTGGFSTRQFAIVDLEKKQVIALAATPPKSNVGHMAWSPDSALLALTYFEEVEGTCGDIADRLGSIAGHPVRCVALGIEVLDSRGMSVGRTLFARNVPNGGTGVAWVD
jgi:hypothetical protein